MSKPEKKLAEYMMKQKALMVVHESVEGFIKRYNDEQDVYQIPIRLEFLDRVYMEFQEIQAEIEKFDSPEMFDEHLQERAAFETRFCKAKGFLLMKRSTDPSQIALNSSMIAKYSTFRQDFISAKLQYLLQSLEGEAHKPFETVDIEADNYASTWDALLKRYDNKRFLKRQLFRALYDLAPLKRESPKELHDLVDDYQRHVRALSKLGYPVDQPTELQAGSNDPLGLGGEDKRLGELSDLQIRSNQPGQVKVAGFTQVPKKFVKMVSNSATTESKSYAPSCIACPESHFLFQCPAFSKMSVRQCRELRTGHQGRNCTSKYDCRSCHQKHHTLLHQNPTAQFSSTPVAVPCQPSQQPNPAMSNIDVVPGSANPNSQVSMSAHSYQSTVLLETVTLFVVDQNGMEHSACALLDTGSMCSFITKKNGQYTQPPPCEGRPCRVWNRRILQPNQAQIDCYYQVQAVFKIPEVPLADPKFHVPADIDLVVGGKIYHELHTGSKISLGEGEPVFVEIVFGWTVSGKVPIHVPGIQKICHLTTVDRNLEQALQKFWDLEAVEQCSMFTAEENLCEELFTTTTRESSGRYVLSLPLTRDPLVTLGESRSIAERRFLSHERRLKRDPATKEPYCRFMEDYERLSHTVRLVDPVDEAQPHCCLPHHPVFKEFSTTTKIRVVFDASCKTSSGFSVNDLQLVGPVVQEDLLSIHIRFRSHQIALVADVEKMYRQILVHPSFRRYQLVLWRPHPSQPIATYELQTVTYGFASAPFLATRTLQRIAQDTSGEYPAAAPKVQKDFYVDDFFSGSDNVESAIRVRQETSAMLASAGFPLKK
ncbi:uncharacterized protein LOC134207125 [Armigeres subalbatus]|uniref:uncharacterized protein LOC134207125 n=1 Tax=Armigeres subalbatus TaxID=124917 RepID=UPI002ED5B8A8